MGELTLRYIVLGHTGFVGKNLTLYLANKGNEVIGLSSRECDLREYSELKNKIASIGKVDAIFNCAANVGSVHYVTSYAGDVISDNSFIALNLYKAVQELCPETTIVNLLSNCCYVDGTQIQEEDKWLDGAVHPSVFSFGNFKRVLYYISKCYKMQYDINSINLMFSGIYGPGDSTDPNKVHALNGMIIRMLEAIDNDDDVFEIWGTGKPIREWIYIDDVCKILLLSLQHKSIIEPVNVAQGKGFAIAETAQNIATATGFAGDLTFNTQYQDGAPIKILGMGKFNELFEDYVFYDHQEGVAKTVNYYREVL
jgi:GDP-L-fucose synthase